MYDHKSWMGQQSHMTGLSLSLSLSFSLSFLSWKDNDKNVNLSFKGIKLKYND